MRIFAIDPERLAERIGARPFVLLAILVALAVSALVVLVFVARWAARHARRIWPRTAGAWRAFARAPVMGRLEARFPLVWRIVRRLSATEYLLLHLALGLALSLAAVSFLVLASEVAEGATIVRVDMALARSLHAASDESGVAVILSFTQLGSGWFLTALGVVVAAGLLRRGRRVLAVGWTVAMLGGGVLNTVLKGLYARPRPSFADPIAVAQGFSFPSGHAMGTFVAAGMLSYLGFRVARTATRRVAVVSAALSWSVAMGFSRMYLGVHFLSDVVAGFAAGTVWLAACISGVEIATRRPPAPALEVRDA